MNSNQQGIRHSYRRPCRRTRPYVLRGRFSRCFLRPTEPWDGWTVPYRHCRTLTSLSRCTYAKRPCSPARSRARKAPCRICAASRGTRWFFYDAQNGFPIPPWPLSCSSFSMPSSQKYYVYILRCSDQSLYVGHTTNLKNRLYWHYMGFASRYTAQRRPVTLVYSEKFGDKETAIAREHQLKSWSRLKKTSPDQW